jgi:hypothetical protein
MDFTSETEDISFSERSETETESESDLDTRIRAYLGSFIKTDTFFTSWDLPQIMIDLKVIQQAGDTVCLYIAANMSSGNRMQIRISCCADPSKTILELNDRKRKDGNSNRDGWRMLVFVVAKVSVQGQELLKETLDACKRERRLPTRIVALMRFAFDQGIPLRFCEDILSRSSPWYMNEVKTYLNRQPTFIGFVESKLEEDPMDED